MIEQRGAFRAHRVAPQSAHLQRAPGKTLPKRTNERAAVHVAGDLPGAHHHFERWECLRHGHSAKRVTMRSGHFEPEGEVT